MIDRNDVILHNFMDYIFICDMEYMEYQEACHCPRNPSGTE